MFKAFFLSFSLLVFSFSTSLAKQENIVSYDTIIVKNDSMFIYTECQEEASINWSGKYFCLKAKGRFKTEKKKIDGYAFDFRVKEGKWRHYFTFGGIFREGNYKHGEEEGLWIEYFENGKIFQKKIYKTGKENGTRETYSDNGEIVEKKEYKVGVFLIDGKETEFSENGVKVKEAELNSNGKYNGKYIEWNLNGKIRVLGEYDNGKEMGKWLGYNEEGEIYRAVEIVNDSTVKETMFYDSQHKNFEGIRVKDIPEGLFTQYYRSGKIEHSGLYHQGKKEGEWKYYDLEGKVMKTEIYKEGELIDKKF